MSVTFDVTAGASLQTPPPKFAPPDPTASDGFAALVDSNLPAPPSSQLPPAPEPPPPQNAQGSPAETPAPTDRSSTGDTTASRQAPSNTPDSPSGDGTNQPVADTAPGTAGTGNSTAGNLQGGTKPTTSKPGNTKSTDNAASSAGVADSTQPPAAHVTTAIPPAAVISLAPQQGVASKTATGSTNSTGPLAIAAAAIARSSSTTAALTATPSLGKVASLPVSPPGAKVAAEASVQTAAKQPGTPADPTLDADVAAVATPNVTAAKPTTPAKTANAGTAGASATATPANALEQASTTASDATATPVVAIKGNATITAAADQNNLSGSASPSPSTSTLHEQISISTDPQASAAPADNGAQAAPFTVPLQPASTVPSLTVVPATGGPVPLSGLAVEIAASVQSGRTRFEVRLDPADLGQIDVRIDVDRSGQVTSHLTVEKPETLSMLQQDAPQLQQALNDAGLKTGSGGLQFSLRDQSSSGQNNNGNLTNGNAHQLVVSEEDTASPAAAGRYGRIGGTSGGIDIRV